MSDEWQFLITLNEQWRPLRDPVEIQRVAVRLIGEHLQASRVHYTSIDGDDFVINHSYLNGATPLPPRGSVVWFGKALVAACRRGETVVIDDTRTDPRLTQPEREPLLAAGIAAFVAIPLIKDGQWVGTFAVHSATPRAWTRDQTALIELTSERTWAAGERPRVQEALVRTESRQAFLRRLNETISPLAHPARILEETCRLLGTHLRVNRVIYVDIGDDGCVTRGEYTNGVAPLPVRFSWRSLVGSRAADIFQGGTLTINDTSAEPHTAEERVALEAAGIGAYTSPLLIKNGRFVGAFGVHSRLSRAWSADEISLVEEVADRTWATLEHRKAEAELRANEELLAFLLRLNDALRPLSDPGAVQQTAARLLREHLDVNRVGYAELEEHQFIIRHENVSGVRPMAGRGARTFGAALISAYRRGETVVVTDVSTDSRFTDAERTGMAERQIAAFVGVPLIKNGQMVAAFGANNASRRDWTPTEVAMIRDVAERTWEAVERARVEETLREREHRFRLALEASGGTCWTWDPHSNDASWDDAFRAHLDIPPETQLTFDTWLASVHDDDRDRMRTIFAEVLEKKDTWDHSYRAVHADGTVSWMQSLGRADRDAAGQVTRLTGLELDVTERRRAEEALQAHREEEHDRELRLLLETATQGIVSVDAQGMIVTANRAVETMFGWSPDELLGQPLKRLLPSTLRNSDLHRTDSIAVRKDGSTFSIEVTLNHVLTARGIRAIAFITDITERLYAAAALQERTAELEHRTSQLSLMAWELTLAEHHAREQIARTLHDGLQQLLLIAALNLQQAQNPANGDIVDQGEMLAEASRHLDEAIAAARSLHLELFPPALQRSGLPAALEWLARWAHEKYRLDVQVNADPRADSSRKDIRTLLFESVRELLFNAFKHAHAHRVTLELTLGADDHVCIVVGDDGIGFDLANLNARSKSEQVGWGLFSIRERLTLLGGRVDIDTAPGRGTRVRVVAPRGAAPAPVQPTVLTDALPAPAALRILIADDHAALRGALRGILQQRPELLVVGDASNGLEAIAHAHALRPDVIIMDVSMPEMDGVEATARIRAALPHIQILGLSMQTRGATGHPIEDAGAAAFFIKGTDTQRLVDHLLALHTLGAPATRAGL